MDTSRFLTFKTKFRLPSRLKKKRRSQQQHHEPSLDMEQPPSYDECSVFFYAPPSYEESVCQTELPRTQERHVTNRMSWFSDTSTSSFMTASSSPSSSSSFSCSRCAPTAPPFSPLSTPIDTSSTLSLWLSAVSSSNSRNGENMSRMGSRNRSSESLISNTSESDVIARTQPRLRSWTQCLRWVVQYTLEKNFKSTIAHFHCLVKNAIRVSQQNGRNSEMYPIRLATLAVPRPSSLSLKTWTEFILSMGFKFSQTNNLNINNNNDENDSSFLASVIASLNETNNNNNNNNNSSDDNNNYNNNNGNVSSNELGDLSVIVPSGLVPSRLMKYRHVLTGLLELPHTSIKTAANLSRTETERIIELLTPLIQAPPRTMSVEHALVRPIWDIHRRPGCFLMSLDFAEFRAEGGKFLKVPTGEVARRRFHLAKLVLEMFLRT
ncbi:uncharacterized protein [Asterias amurensis]|uniref:uncharacterized protein n=1 Tax=Asterias amurensis TaxID=7602 RepID=UPI003AB4C416